MKATIFAKLGGGIDATFEIEAEDRASIEAEVTALIENLALQPRGAVTFGQGNAEEQKPEGPKCNCGNSMIWREGTSRSTGKFYKGWFCRDSKCKPVFLGVE